MKILCASNLVSNPQSGYRLRQKLCALHQLAQSEAVLVSK